MRAMKRLIWPGPDIIIAVNFKPVIRLKWINFDKLNAKMVFTTNQYKLLQFVLQMVFLTL